MFFYPKGEQTYHKQSLKFGFDYLLLKIFTLINHHPHDVSFRVSLRKNSIFLSIGYFPNRSEEPKNGSTEHLQFIVVVMMSTNYW